MQQCYWEILARRWGMVVRGIKLLIKCMMSIVKVSCIFLLALLLPRLFVYYSQQQSSMNTSLIEPAFKLGLENMADATMRNLINQKASIALITNHTGKDREGRRNIDMLLGNGVVVKAIFTPKHGFYADKNRELDNQILYDAQTSVPMVSWYGNSYLRDTYVNDIDVLVFDLQDSGMRQSYSVMLLDVLKKAIDKHKKVIVLDRPNALGSSMEGGLGQELSTIPVPSRHGMTTGELAHYLNKYVLNSAAQVSVVLMENYHRKAMLTASPWFALSPNINTASSCYGYSFLGILGEVIPFDIGIGTSKSFQCLLLPEKIGFAREKWYQLRHILATYGVESKWYRTFSKRKNEYCNGLALHVRDINNFSSFHTLLAILHFFKQEGLQLSFSSKFDDVIGSTKVRKFIEGSVERKELEQEVNDMLVSFYDKAKYTFLYKPLPKIIKV